VGLGGGPAPLGDVEELVGHSAEGLGGAVVAAVRGVVADGDAENRGDLVDLGLPGDVVVWGR
jgi:hypothetical protein